MNEGPGREAVIGLSFDDARKRVLSAFKRANTGPYEKVYSRWDCVDEKLCIWLGFNLFVVTVLVVCYILNQERVFQSGFLLTAVILFGVVVVNLGVVIQYRHCSRSDLSRLITSILTQYEAYYLLQAKKPPSQLSFGTYIPTGHSQLSIINTYRNGAWIKVPYLLLAEGDIIALMGGDVTPCKVYELVPRKESRSATTAAMHSHTHSHTHSHPATENKVKPELFDPWRELKDTNLSVGASSSTAGASSAREGEVRPSEDRMNEYPQSLQRHWEVGQLLQSGTKILINKHGKRSTSKTPLDTAKRSRSKSVMETDGPRPPSPTDSSALPPLPPAASVPPKSSSSSSFSNERHRSLGPESTEILRLSGDIRCFMLAETPIEHFVSTVYANHKPDLNYRTFFSQLLQMVVDHGRNVIKLYLVVFAIAVAIRLAVFPESRRLYAISVLSPFATILLTFVPVSIPFILIGGEAMGTAEILSTLEVTLHKSEDTSTTLTYNQNNAINTSGHQLPASPSRLNRVGTRTESLNHHHNTTSNVLHTIEEHEDDDEFVDEDIDRRAEDIAEETDTKVEYRRFFLYALNVLYTRLFGRTIEDVEAIVDVYNSSSSLVGVQASKRPPLLPIPLFSMNLVDQLGSITMVCFVDDDIICENYSVTEEIFLLTEKHEDRDVNGDSGVADMDNAGGVGALSRARSANVNVKGTVLDLHANPEATGSRFENPMWWKFLPSLKPLGINAMLTYKHTATKSPTLQSDSSSRTTNFNKTANVSNKESLRSVIERSLVRHIQQTLPLEALRELAEEIGFTEDDLAPFMRVLEINVIASGLENAHLLEDNHQWGQEESRRRGSLIPQLRGAVYQDQRGGLQMMSLGDPTLILNYCREYWDGSTSNITPLSAADRMEVLNVYERWRLEDFDVVAFCYTPMPVSSLVYFDEHHTLTSIPPLGHNHAKKSSTFRSAYTDDDRKNRTLFFVDPSNVDVLMGRKPQIPTVVDIAESKKEEEKHIDSETEEKATGADDPSDLKEFGSPEQCVIDNLADVHPQEKSETSFVEDPHSLYPLLEPTSVPDVLPVPHFDCGSADEEVLNILHCQEETLHLPIISRPPSASVISQPPLYTNMYTEQENLSVAGGESVAGCWDEVHTVMDSALLHHHNGSGHGRSHIKRSVSDSNLQAFYHHEVTMGNHGPMEQMTTSGKFTFHLNDERNDQWLLSPEAFRLSTKHVPELLDDSASTSLSPPPPLASKHSFFDRESPKPTRSLSMSLSLLSQANDNVEVTEVNPGSLVNNYQSETDVLIRTETERNPRLDSPEDSAFCGLSLEGVEEVVPLIKTRSLDRIPSSTPSPKLATISSSRKHRSKSSSPPPFAEAPDDDEDSPLTGDKREMPGREIRSYSLSQHNFFSTKGSSSRRHGADHHHNGRDGADRVVSSSDHYHDQEHKSSRANALLSQTHESERGKMRRSGATTTSAAHRLLKQQRRSALRQLWSLLRQQVFLGMAASSVPVRKDVPNTKEDLEVAGIRFVYFSAQNMKRSKPVAEKLGIQFDWNCAISLRELDGSDSHDPHRHISSYADWDVLARMPHGIEAIKHHLQHVDNVPLLVSLFTDATPETIDSMVGIFRENGEVVLAVGAGYRAYNQQIYSASNLATSLTYLPNILSFIPAEERDVLSLFPTYSSASLTRSELRLSFDLVALGTIDLLQLRSLEPGLLLSPSLRDISSRPDPALMEHVHLSVLLETIRKGRVLLLNKQQALAFSVIFIASLACWPVLSQALPVSIAPTLPPPLALVFSALYLPLLTLPMLFNDDHEHVMKNTPRKNALVVRPRDSQRFYNYFLVRVGTVCIGVLATGYMAAASLLYDESDHTGLSFYTHLTQLHRVFQSGSDSSSQIFSDSANFCLLQDMMAHAMLLCLLAQSLTLLVRGQRPVRDFPWPRYYKEYYFSLVLVLLLHVLITSLRAALRTCIFHSSSAHWLSGLDCSSGSQGNASYKNIHGLVWATLFIMVAMNLVGGLMVNHYDGHFYRRHLQFLRLEFDTRLGMHSPR
eukprot:gene3638-3983_t